MGLIDKLLGREGKAKVVIVTSKGRDVRYVDMSRYGSSYQLLKAEIESNPDSRKISVRYQGQTLEVDSH
ncbi:MAG: hypothetical protein ABSG05_01250 [Candidatus Pacearchaeota archaeon]|jgi:hypothetical protein